MYKTGQLKNISITYKYYLYFRIRNNSTLVILVEMILYVKFTARLGPKIGQIYHLQVAPSQELAATSRV